MKNDPDAPKLVDKAEQDEVVELYHWIDMELRPTYVTVAVSDEADCPTSYESGPEGAKPTVGSAFTVTATVTVASLPSESVTSKQYVVADMGATV